MSIFGKVIAKKQRVPDFMEHGVDLLHGSNQRYKKSRKKQVLLYQLFTWKIWQPRRVPTQTKCTMALAPIHATHGAHMAAFTRIIK